MSELNTRKRPETAVTQFKNSLNRLMDILMCKEPSYIRCIKPNDFQSPDLFNEEVVSHQVCRLPRAAPPPQFALRLIFFFKHRYLGEEMKLPLTRGLFSF